jgi:hypothetical protein
LLADRSRGLTIPDVTHAMRRMSTILGPVLAVTFVAAAFIGTTSACWLGSLAALEASGVGSAPVLRFLCTSCTVVAFASEMLKLALASRLGHPIAGRRRCQAVVVVLWGTCVMYGSLMPAFLMMNMPIWPATGGAMFAFCATTWAFIQLASGLAPVVNWSTSRQPGIVDHLIAAGDTPKPTKPAAPETRAAGKQPMRLDEDACFALLRDIAFGPDPAIGTRIRVGPDHEIIASQQNLANYLGLSKSTFHRFLQGLATQGRLSWDYTEDGVTRIKLAPTTM